MPGLHHGDNPWLHRVRNMPFLINSWICLNKPRCAWTSLNLLEWLFLHFHIVIICLFEREVTYFKVCSKVWKNMRLFIEEIKFDFFIEPGSTCIIFCYRLNSFIRFQICCYLSEAINLDILWQGSERPLTCITFYIIIFKSDILFRSVK